VAQLLVALEYDDGIEEPGSPLWRSGDGGDRGIDGFIRLDAWGSTVSTSKRSAMTAIDGEELAPLTQPIDLRLLTRHDFRQRPRMSDDNRRNHNASGWQAQRVSPVRCPQPFLCQSDPASAQTLIACSKHKVLGSKCAILDGPCGRVAR